MQRILNNAKVQKAGLALLVWAGVAACAHAATVPATQLDTVKRVCRDTMGLTAPNTDYVACVDSLTGSLAEAATNRAEASANLAGQSACSQKGLTPDTPDYAMCVLNYRDKVLGNATHVAAYHSTQNPIDIAGGN
ncbi:MULTISPECIES: hypothetical protein [Nitrospirillum]|uniref:Uncharacterized protein n=1 Tax=Nitrospirillum amazonense TaxID=28077 RepID=A0A560HNN3_9PROT|nr:hypothetical protein [Nitrospirillum amazonense]MEC4590182.1 hypothetical protein [Nitrospirillum amazonense]TWB24942.1 hypothetical protein FBZ88_11119 [Nitrospirillum amazonense]TWB48176.1 hypothetical protein FBZ92_13127 [Nitrospirillum amazonense]